MSEEADQGVKSVVVEDDLRCDGGSVIQNQEQGVLHLDVPHFRSFCSSDNW